MCQKNIQVVILLMRLFNDFKKNTLINFVQAAAINEGIIGTVTQTFSGLKTFNNNIGGSISGNIVPAINIGITDDATISSPFFSMFVTANTGNLPQKVISTKLSLVPSTLTAISFVGKGAGLNEYVEPIKHLNNLKIHLFKNNLS